MDESQDQLAKAFGERLAKLREDACQTQSELASRCGFKRAYVWRVENGGTLPSIRTAAKLADGLGTTISNLLEGL